MSENSGSSCSIQIRPPLGFGLAEVVIVSGLGLLPALALGLRIFEAIDEVLCTSVDTPVMSAS